MIYRCIWETREKRRAKTFYYTLAMDLQASSPEEARRKLDNFWPNHQPLPHRWRNHMEETQVLQYSKPTRIGTRYETNKYIKYI